MALKQKSEDIIFPTGPIWHLIWPTRHGIWLRVLIAPATPAPCLPIPSTRPPLPPPPRLYLDIPNAVQSALHFITGGCISEHVAATCTRLCMFCGCSAPPPLVFCLAAIMSYTPDCQTPDPLMACAPVSQTMGAEKTAVGVPMLSGAELFKWGNRERSNFAIYGDDNQVVEVSLAPGEVVRTETGGLMHMHHMLEQEVTTDQGCMRCCCAGQSFFQSHFENKSAGPVTIALSPSYPAKIIPLDLARYSGIFLKKGAFLGAVSHDVRSIKFEVIRPPNLGTAFCGSGGLFLTRVTGMAVSLRATCRGGCRTGSHGLCACMWSWCGAVQGCFCVVWCGVVRCWRGVAWLGVVWCAMGIFSGSGRKFDQGWGGGASAFSVHPNLHESRRCMNFGDRHEHCKVFPKWVTG